MEIKNDRKKNCKIISGQESEFYSQRFYVQTKFALLFYLIRTFKRETKKQNYIKTVGQMIYNIPVDRHNFCFVFTFATFVRDVDENAEKNKTKTTFISAHYTRFISVAQ